MKYAQFNLLILELLISTNHFLIPLLLLFQISNFRLLDMNRLIRISILWSIWSLSFIETNHAKGIWRNPNCECGVLPKTRVKRSLFDFKNPKISQIVGGYKTKPNEYPWIVGLCRDPNCR